MNQAIDITQPRECIYQEFEEQPGPCPRCGAALAQSNQVYLVITRRGGKMTDSFITSSDMGWFCANCPTVVINPKEVAEMFQVTKPGWDAGSEHIVAGIIDLDAVPPSQHHVPFDELDPLPLVQFSNQGAASTAAPVEPRRISSPKPAGARKTSQFQSTWSEAKSSRRKKKHR